MMDEAELELLKKLEYSIRHPVEVEVEPEEAPVPPVRKLKIPPRAKFERKRAPIVYDKVNESLAKIAQRIEDSVQIQQDTLELLRAQVPLGESVRISVPSVTSTPTIIDDQFILANGEKFDPPYTKVDIFNDGSSKVFFSVNKRGEFYNQQPYAQGNLGFINPNDMYVEDLKVPQLEILALFCQAGQTSSVRAFFKR